MHILKSILQKAFFVVMVILLTMCSKKIDQLVLVPAERLDSYIIQHQNQEQDILIACAASDPDSIADGGISVFFYPFTGAFDYKYFESSSDEIDPMDFTKYVPVEKESEAVFGGHLRRFTLPFDTPEKWIVLTFLSVEKIHVSDPIRLKHESKPTLYNSDLIEIDQQDSGHPKFSWEGDSDDETVIYFEVISGASGNFISGTYTYDKHWQYYDLSNVVLNITEQEPPADLKIGNNYTFTLMGVSEDNWVNLMAVKTFEAK